MRKEWRSKTIETNDTSADKVITLVQHEAKQISTVKTTGTITLNTKEVEWEELKVN